MARVCDLERKKCVECPRLAQLSLFITKRLKQGIPLRRFSRTRSFNLKGRVSGSPNLGIRQLPMKSRTTTSGRRREDAEIEEGGDKLEKDSNKGVSGCTWCRPYRVRLCSSSEVPPFMRRPYIASGYRPGLSPMQCIASLGYVHNELGNIWTHLGGALFIGFTGLTHENANLDESLLPRETLVQRAFLFAAAACLLTSAVYHTGNCSRNEAACTALLRADVSGVAVLIAASFLPGVYYGFACHPHLRHAYLVMVLVLLIVGLGVSLVDVCSTHSTVAHSIVEGGVKNLAVEAPPGAEVQPRSLLQRIRTATFVSFVALGLAVAIHWAVVVDAAARSKYLPKVRPN